MNKMHRTHITPLILLAIACLFNSRMTLAQDMSQPLLRSLAEQMEVTYQLVSNVDVTGCEEVFGGPCFHARLQLALPKTQTLPSYTLYFSHIAPIKWDDHDSLEIQHINGDLHQIIFSGAEFTEQSSLSIGFKAAFWHVNRSDIMPNFFISADGVTPEIIRTTIPLEDTVTGLQVVPHAPTMSAPEQYRRGSDDALPLANAAWLFEHYRTINAGAAEGLTSPRIIPNVKQANWSETASLDLSGGLHIQWGEFVENAVLVGLLEDKGLRMSDTGVPLKLVKDNALDSGQYQLHIQPQQITVKAANREALQYGVVSLYQLLNKDQPSLAVGQITDTPRYDFRGVHMDLARNFLGKVTVMKLIRQMFLLKLNKLHLHLADDEGWRLQLTRLPELTDIGGYRCFDPAENQCLLPQLGSGPHKNSPVNGYLTESDYLEIIQYAHARHIEIIPSFDLPGHARAAVKAMEARYRKLKAQENKQGAEEFLLTDFADDTAYSSVQFYTDNTVNPCMASTYHFINTVISDVKALHAKVNVPLTTYHIGADETAGAWKQSPVCQALIDNNPDLNSVSDLKPYFLNRVLDIVAAHGLKAAGWSDGMHKVISARANEGHQVNVWDTLYWGGHKIADEFNQQGWDTVLSIPDANYFDFPYQNTPQETGYYWAAKNTDEFKVFQFMPDNLAANALQWTDRKGHPYSASMAHKAGAVSGIQTQIWTEAVRTPNTFDYLMFPRLHAFAERAWYKAPWELSQKPGFQWQQGAESAQLLVQQSRDWQSFSRALVTAVLALHKNDVAFRLPPAGAKIINGQLMLNSPWQGLVLEYQLQGMQWRAYTAPVSIAEDVPAIKVRTRLAETQKTSRVQVVNNKP